MKYNFPTEHFLLNTPSLAAFKKIIEHWLTASSRAFIDSIPPQMHSFSITLWWAMLIFILFVLSTGNKVLTNSLYIWMFDWHRFSRCSPFWFLNPLKYLLVQLWFFDHTLCELLHSGEGMFKLLGVKMLISSVSPSTYSVIYSKTYALYLSKF